MHKLSILSLFNVLVRLKISTERKRIFYAVICLSCSLSFVSLLQRPAFALEEQVFSLPTQLAQRRRRQYRPPADARIPRRNHSGGGVRGCGEEIAAIAPRLSSIGQTLSTHPTLVWYNYSDDAEPLELHLYRYRAGNTDGSAVEQVFVKAVGNSQKGYMSYTLPESEPGLQIGETYFWQVVLYCDPNREEVGMWTAADIQVVSDSMGIAAQLSGDAVSDAQVYSEAGLWYEAIAAIDKLNTPAADNLRQTMLLDLADLEAETDAESTPTLVEQLRRIAAEE